MTKTASHAAAGLDATLASGIRSTFCYSLVPQITHWDENVYELETPSKSIPEWFLPELERLCRRIEKEGEGNVRIGLGFDSFHLPRGEVTDCLSRAREIGAKLLTVHWRRNNIAGKFHVKLNLLIREEIQRPSLQASRQQKGASQGLQRRSANG